MRKSHMNAGRIGLYAFLFISAAFFTLPLYTMIVTSLKSMEEIRNGGLFDLPIHVTFDAWRTAWSGACMGTQCNGVQVGFFNSIKITVPAVIISVVIGAVNGYALSLWNPKGGKVLFFILMAGGLIPFQIFLYPLVRLMAVGNLYNTVTGVVFIHVIFGLPLVTLLFRNHFVSVPLDLLKAARVDGAGFWRIFFEIMLPMSIPIVVVAAILQFTGIWNDFLLGLVFAGKDNLPMTVQLNNIVNTTMGERAYNVNMAATILTALVPLLVYFFSGRWFVRGVTAGAVKG